MTKGKLIIISGPSGAGKSTIVRALMAQSPGAFFSVSATTRPIRPGEEDGVDYRFVCTPSFAELERRLRARGTNSEEDIRRRLAQGRSECENADMYTYLIINDDREKAAAEAAAILVAEDCRNKDHLSVLKGE